MTPEVRATLARLITIKQQLRYAEERAAEPGLTARDRAHRQDQRDRWQKRYNTARRAYRRMAKGGR